MTAISRKLGWVVLGLAALLQAGCMLAIAGAAAGAGTAGYLYYNGLLYRDYHAHLGDAAAAVRTSLVELQFPLLKEKNDSGSAYFQSQTGDGHAVRIYLDTVPSPIPSEGAVTRISVRVGFSGDEGVSARVLDQVSKHLVSPALPGAAAALAPAAPPVSPAVHVAPAAPPQTPPPPLAGDRLVPVAATRK
ncbi:MAG: DUF3568 family protein [Gemmataceae bacterium]